MKYQYLQRPDGIRFQRNRLLLVLSLLIAVSAAAQDPPPFLRTVIVDVKSDKVADFVAVQKQFNAAAQKAGLKQRTTWQVAMGPTSQFRITTPLSSLAELDEGTWLQRAIPDAGQRANWVARVTACTDRRQVVVSRTRPEASIPPKDGKQPAHLLIYVTENLNGQMQVYRSALEDELIPAYKKAGVDGILTMQRVFGASQREFIIARGFEKWEELDGGLAINIVGPAAEALGNEKTAALANKMGSLLSRQERIVLTRRDDLSFSSD